MADKIANFEDYKKRDARGEEPVKERKAAHKTAAPMEEPEKTPVSQETMNIEIEDPYQFLNAKEREEYILERQKEMQENEGNSLEYPEEDIDGEEDYDPEFDEEYNEEYNEETDEGYQDDAGEEDEEKDDRNILFLVRVASIITGLVILIFIGMLVKTRVIDRYLIPGDDDEAAVAVTTLAIPSGFTEKNDTVVVSGASSLNLRSGPDTNSSVLGKAPEGTELKRIAVADDGNWALLEYEGQQVYASMKYLDEK